MEKIYDDHRKFLLKIIYDTAGHPVLWVPSSKLLPVNVSRTSSGQISTLQRGPTTEKLGYDTQGRLVSRVFADGKIWSYTYLERVSEKSLSLIPKQIVKLNNTNIHKTGTQALTMWSWRIRVFPVSWRGVNLAAILHSTNKRWQKQKCFHTYVGGSDLVATR